MRGFAKNITNWKAATVLVAAVLLLCSVSGAALAAKPGGGGGGHSGGGGHGGGGGGRGGGGGHGNGGGGRPAGLHINMARTNATNVRPNLGRRSSRGGRQNFSTTHHHAVTSLAKTKAVSQSVRGHNRNAHSTAGRTNNRNRALTNTNVKNRALTNTNVNNRALTNARVRPLANAANPRSFANRRRFAANAAFRPFWGNNWWHHGWHPYYHLGWIGPLFWPYAYGDFFYYALWPYDYADADPFWVYGYGDIYTALFSPYDYQDYVQGPGAPARMATLTQNMAQSCDDEAAEVTGWPIDQIQSAVQPNPQQSALLDNLGNAVVEASHQIRTHCPTSVAFTPPARLDQMHERLQTLVGAVNLIEPPLTKFYDSLSDEQKARFNGIAPPNAPGNANAAANETNAGDKPNVQAQCNANVMAWPSDRIDSAIHPTDAQRGKSQALQSALSQAADTIKAACPSGAPATPPERLADAGKRLQAMLQGVETVQPALADFYNSLSDDQKARFNSMGRQLFAQNQP